MSKIFISWSKNKSEELAKLTKHTLEELLPDTNFFMSEEDIQAGDCVQNTIMHQIEQCDIFILCFITWFLYNLSVKYFVLLPIIKNLRGYYTKQDMLVGCINELFQFYLIKILYGIHG